MAFSSQLRDDFQFASPAWLSPRSATLADDSVEFTLSHQRFFVGQIMPQTLPKVNACI